MRSSFLCVCAAVWALGCSSDVDPDAPAGPSSGSGSGADTGGSGTAGSGSNAGGGGADASGGQGAEGGANAGGRGPGGAGGEGGEGTGGAGGGMLSPQCQALSLVEVSSPVVHDEGEDGTWSPDENAEIRVLLTNTSAIDNLDYPGVAITSDHPEVESSGPNFLFGLLGNMATEISVGFHAGAAIPPGTVIHFVATVTNLAQDCTGMDSVAFEATIE